MIVRTAVAPRTNPDSGSRSPSRDTASGTASASPRKRNSAERERDRERIPDQDAPLLAPERAKTERIEHEEREDGRDRDGTLEDVRSDTSATAPRGEELPRRTLAGDRLVDRRHRARDDGR